MEFKGRKIFFTNPPDLAYIYHLFELKFSYF